MTNAQDGFAEAGIMDAGWREARAGHKAGGRNRQQDREAHGRTETAAPAFLGSPSEPASTASLDRANRDACGIQDLRQFLALRWPERCQEAGDLLNERATGVLMARTVALVRQRGNCRETVTLCQAIKGTLAGKPSPLPE